MALFKEKLQITIISLISMMNGTARQISSGNYHHPRKLFRNADLQGIAMNDFLEKHNDEELSPEFKIFNCVINDFFKRNRIYSRTAHSKRSFDGDPKSNITFKDGRSTNELFQ